MPKKYKKSYSLFKCFHSRIGIDFDFEDIGNIDQLYYEIKHEFYNDKTYKWSLKKCLSYIESNRIKPLEFIGFLDLFFFYYFSLNYYKKGEKGALKFVKQLSGSNKFLKGNYSFGGLRLNEDVDILIFLEEMKNIKKYLKISHNDYIKFIFQTYGTGYSETTLRKYYYDRTI